MKKRVRFAPSPTGLFHVGSARVALVNYLFSKKNNGKFVLRIEDTDKERSKKEYEINIIESLEWLGLDYDEGPNKGGEYGPYRQSERRDIYKKYTEKLLDKGHAYRCFCDEKELEKEREAQREKGEAPTYSGKCRNLSEEEVEEKLKKGEDYVIRMKVNKGETVSFEDKIRGKVTFETDVIGDYVIAKDEETPLYNLACAIDDYEMKISHVIRGEDHISNTPKQVLIQNALGFNEITYAHLPLILAPDKSKLSKRFGAVSVTEYQKQGFLPEALDNFLALLGWSPGDDREFFTLPELEKEFTLDRCKKSGAVFNKEKLTYINTLHIKKANPERLAKLCIPYLVKDGFLNPKHETDQYPPALGAKGVKTTYKTNDGRKFSFDKITTLVKEHQDRIETLKEISEVTDYFFEPIQVNFELLQWKEMDKSALTNSIDKAIKVLSDIDNWDQETVSKELLEKANEYDDRGKFLWPLRAALTGKQASAGPFEVAYILGREEAIKRLKASKKVL
ncbi:MAG: glutamate--tRNA ligase [Patescibacteria group bacterium]